MTQLQSEVRELRETFLRAVDIVEKMGQAMDTLHVANDNRSIDIMTQKNSSRRTKRNGKYPETDINMENPSLVNVIAEKMRNMPMQNVRKIRSGSIYH